MSSRKGKNPFTREQQIRGLKKSIRNPKTPRQFLAGMKARLAKLESR